MFVSGTDFHLRAGSPMIDAGVYVGLPYAGAAPDKGFAEFGAIILPVKLMDVTVTENKGKNLLQWKTATESNSDYFSIERSSDGQHFEAIGKVTATGFSTTIMNYNFTDATPLTGMNYYRLVMVDKDNSKEYSNTVSVLNRAAQSLNIAAAQLSTGKNNMSLTVNSTQNQKANVMVFDQNGRMMLNEATILQKGANIINKNISSISRGIYYVKLSTADEMAVKNILAAE